MFYERHLKYIKLNTEFVHFTRMNLTYLLKVRKVRILIMFNASSLKLREVYKIKTDLYWKQMFQDNYDINFVNEVYQSTVVSFSELKSGKVVAPGAVRIPYYSRQAYKNTAKQFGLMDDFRVIILRWLNRECSNIRALLHLTFVILHRVVYQELAIVV